MQIRPLHDGIIFRFNDATVSHDGAQKRQFKESTDWGFEFSNTDDTTQNPRWGTVVSIGPDVKEVKAGDSVLITALKWTNAFELNGDRHWKTDEDQVLAKEG